MTPTATPESGLVLRRPRAIGLDLDGTLVDSAPDIAWAANAALAELGLPTLPEAQIRGMIGDGIDALLRRCLSACEAIGDAHRDSLQDSLQEKDPLQERDPAEDPEALFERARPVLLRHYGENVFQRGSVYPGVLEALQGWRAEGITLVCITNKASRFAEPLLRACGLWPLLAGLYGGDRRDERKPAPLLIQRCLSDFSLDPEDFLMVGDSIHDLEAARLAGCPAAAVGYGYGNPAALVGAGRPILERLDDLRFG